VLAVAHVLGLMMAFFGLLYALPIVWSLGVRDGAVMDFVAAALINAFVGLAVALATRRFRRELKPRDGFLLVSLAWTLMSASAAIPFMIAMPDLSFTDAYFEAMSGLTTTGSTILNHLDDMPQSLNLWRHVLHWIGGVGIIVLAVAVLPLLGVGGMQLYRAETPGPVKDEKLTPRITETAKALWFTYLAITLVGIVALHIAGMSWFDAICHCFSAIALGGFSTHDQSVGYFHSASIEMILVVIMLIAALNFSRHFLAFRSLSLKPYKSDSEGKAVLIVLGGSVVVATMTLWIGGTYPEFSTAMRHALFNVVSIATTAGFVTENYETWPAFIPVWLLFLSCITCSTGSTGGGIKMFRTLLLVRQARRELKLLVHPSAVIPIRIGGVAIPDRVAYSVLAFIFLYFGTILVLTFAMLATGLDLVSSFSAIVGSVNSVGPGLGEVGPSVNFEPLTDIQTWICTLAMLIGRLEIFSVLVLFTATFWRR
jgi:trk system potassium uptake protein TrkH